MIERKRWESGQAPAVRRGDLGEPFVCYFCGDKTAIRSYGDDRDDNGRVEVYCDNTNCDAREVVILATRDGGHAHARADTRVLDGLDEAFDGPFDVSDVVDHAQGGRPSRLGRRDEDQDVAVALTPKRADPR